MERRLTIKELAPYLPYKLQWVFEGSDDVHEVVGLDITDFGVHIISPYGDSGRCSIKEGKPLLRPLTYLTEEIEHNGERFVPMVELEKIRKDIEIYRPLNLHYPLEINIQTEDYSQEIDLHDGYLIMQKLHEWHFDTANLLGRSLALPIDGNGGEGMSKLIEVTPQVFEPDYTSINPFDGETVSKGTIIINIDYIKFIEGNCIVVCIGGEDRVYSVFECYEELKEKIAKAGKEVKS